MSSGGKLAAPYIDANMVGECRHTGHWLHSHTHGHCQASKRHEQDCGCAVCRVQCNSIVETNTISLQGMLALSISSVLFSPGICNANVCS